MIVLNNKLTQEADCYIDENHETFSKLGVCFFNIFSYDKGNNRISTQVRNLQQITCSVTRFCRHRRFREESDGQRENG